MGSMCVSLAHAQEQAMIHHAITNGEHTFSLARAKEHTMFRYGSAMLHLIIVLLSVKKNSFGEPWGQP